MSALLSALPPSWSARFHRTSPPRAEPAAADLREEIRYLNGLGPIRVYFADAPGYGHQSATLAVVRRLRALGYTGKIEAVYDDANPLPITKATKAGYGGAKVQQSHYGAVRQKMAELLPEFAPDGAARQHIPSLDMTLQPLASLDGSSPRYAMGLTGGADAEVDFATMLKTDKFLRLSPTDWRGYTEEIFFPGEFTTPVRILDNGKRALIYPPAQDDAISDAYFERLPRANYSRAKRKGLAALARGAATSDLMPIYGLAYMEPISLHAAALGVSQALAARPDLFKGRGVIMPLLLDVPATVEGLESLSREVNAGGPPAMRTALNEANAALRGRLKIASVLDPDIEQTLRELKADEILILQTGSVPPAFFEWLFRRATLPPTLEGKNSMNLARMLGKPYIPVLPASKTSLFEHVERLGDRTKIDEVWAHLTPIDRALQNRDFKTIAAYIVASMQPGSSLRELFTNARIRQDDFDKDKVIAALRVAMTAEPHSGGTARAGRALEPSAYSLSQQRP